MSTRIKIREYRWDEALQEFVEIPLDDSSAEVIALARDVERAFELYDGDLEQVLNSLGWHRG